MEIESNQLARYFGSISLQFADVYHVTIPPGGSVRNGFTSPEGCGLLVPIRGEAVFRTEKHRYHLKPGVIFHGPPRCPIDKQVTGDGEWEYMLLHYIPIPAGKKGDSLCHQDFIVTVRQGSRILSLMEELYRLHILPGSVAEFQVKVCLYELLQEIVLSSKDYQYQPSNMVAHVIRFLQQNYQEQLSIEDLAREYGMERKHFSTVFKQETGVSPSRYLIDYRMHLARELLEQKDCTVTEVAGLVGYPDALYFSRAFKKQNGISPKAFQNGRDKNP